MPQLSSTNYHAFEDETVFAIDHPQTKIAETAYSISEISKGGGYTVKVYICNGAQNIPPFSDTEENLLKFLINHQDLSIRDKFFFKNLAYGLSTSHVQSSVIISIDFDKNFSQEEVRINFGSQRLNFQWSDVSFDNECSKSDNTAPRIAKEIAQKLKKQRFPHLSNNNINGYEVVEELNLLANKISAEILIFHGSPAIYRTQTEKGHSRFSVYPENSKDNITPITSPYRYLPSLVNQRALSETLYNSNPTYETEYLKEVCKILNTPKHKRSQKGSSLIQSFEFFSSIDYSTLDSNVKALICSQADRGVFDKTIIRINKGELKPNDLYALLSHRQDSNGFKHIKDVISEHLTKDYTLLNRVIGCFVKEQNASQPECVVHKPHKTDSKKGDWIAEARCEILGKQFQASSGVMKGRTNAWATALVNLVRNY